MGTKQVVVGLVIFIVVTVASFVMLSQILQISETLSVILAIVIGFGAEVLYRKKGKVS